MVASGVWRPGPVLEVDLEGGEATDVVVGLWADGWFLGERVAEAGARLSVGAFEWEGSSGAELVVRVREGEGVWGPPWRSLVPDSTGDAAFLPEATGGGVPDAGVEARAASIVHSPWLGNPSLSISWTPEPLEAGLAGLLFELPACSAGRCEATLISRIQSWWMEGDRGLDLYF